LPRLVEEAVAAWDRAVRDARRHGLRNAQVTCVAPTGTISFLMDCETTGIEPELALVKEKKLVGGGRLTLVNHAVGDALRALGYPPSAAEAITAHVLRTGAAEGAPGLRAEHLPVFDTAVPPTSHDDVVPRAEAPPSTRALAPRAHLLMMAALQPFLSGAISKTVNLPASATVDDVERVFLDAWRLGTKAVAVYRDRSKVAQPLSPLPGERAVAEGVAGPVCPECGAPMVRAGACATCPSCGATLGCG
jgi:ribonucleoside-diphosphate reductase alpha chain